MRKGFILEIKIDRITRKLMDYWSTGGMNIIERGKRLRNFLLFSLPIIPWPRPDSKEFSFMACATKSLERHQKVPSRSYQGGPSFHHSIFPSQLLSSIGGKP
jgi:hypothetical protein